MLNFVVGGTLLTFAGTNIVNSIVTGTLNTIYSSLLFFKNGTETDTIINKIRKKIDKLDIKIKLDLVNILIVKLPINDINRVIEEGLVELILKIKTLIELIECEISDHKNKWLSGYRGISVDTNYENLINLMSILDGRIALLMSRTDNT